MTRSRLLLAVLGLVTALLLQVTVLARLPLPGGPPDLLLVVVVGVALAEGPRSGMLTGFAAGLLADLAAGDQLGRLALVYVLVGYLAGLVRDAAEGTLVVPLALVALAAAGGVVVYVAEGILLGDPRVTAGGLAAVLGGTVAWSVLVAAVVVPFVGGLLGRVDPDRPRR